MIQHIPIGETRTHFWNALNLVKLTQPGEWYDLNSEVETFELLLVPGEKVQVLSIDESMVCCTGYFPRYKYYQSTTFSPFHLSGANRQLIISRAGLMVRRY